MTRAGMKIRRALRLVGWNTLFLVAGLALIGVVGEMYFRLRAPFVENDTPYTWFPTVGWPIADKFHVRLEELAAEELRHLDITTSAFGISGTGQVNQLAYYDEFARYLQPTLLVLVFVYNDFMNNAPILEGLHRGIDPDRLAEASATRGADGTITLRPPYPPSAESRLAPPRHTRVTHRLTDMSLFANWLDAKWRALSTSDDIDPGLVAQVALLSRRSPGYAALLDGWRPTTREGINDPFRFARDLPAIHEDALDFTAFALDQFGERADRDGAALVILSIHHMGTRGHLGFDRLATLAESRGIPIINQYDYITR